MTTTDKSGQIVKSNGGGTSLAALVRTMTPEIARALPKHVSPERMARVTLTALRTTRGLDKCTAASFAACIMNLSQLGLEPNTPLGLAYLIPFKDTCTAIIGYQGYIELARRSGKVTSIYAYVVREGDRFSYALGLHPTLDHRPSDDAGREDRPITHVYAVAHLRDAEPVFVVLSRGEVEARRKRSRASGAGPWVTDYEAMVQKTAVRAIWKWLPKSAEIAFARDVDHAADLGRAPSIDDEATARALAAQGVFTPEPEALPAEGESVPDRSAGEVSEDEMPDAQ